VQRTITAVKMISNRRIKENVTAIERVKLMKTATLIGEVLTPVLITEEGAKLQGMTDMGVTAWADEPPKLLGNVSDLSAHRAKQVEVLDKESRGETHR